jgi:hypothetical protein
MKSITFKNKFNGDRVICDDIHNNIKIIDGVEYYFVHLLNSPRKFLMRKDSLERVPNNKKVI